MLSIFSWACWSLMYLLWRNVCLSSLFIFNWVCFCCWIMNYSCIFSNR
jgi:hypothetical protein